MFNLTKSQALQLRNLLSSPDYKTYEILLQNLLEDAEKRVWSNPPNVSEVIIERNTIEMIIKEPQKAIDNLVNSIKVQEISDTASL